MQILSCHVWEMTGNFVIWQPQEVESLLYFKQKIQKSEEALILREMHHEAVLKELTKRDMF